MGEVNWGSREKATLRTQQGRGVTRSGKLSAIPGLAIVVTLRVYYPCQDAGTQRPRSAAENSSLQRIHIDLEGLYGHS